MILRRAILSIFLVIRGSGLLLSRARLCSLIAPPSAFTVVRLRLTRVSIGKLESVIDSHTHNSYFLLLPRRDISLNIG